MKKKNIILIISLLVVLAILAFIFIYIDVNKEDTNIINISISELEKKIENTDEFDFDKMQNIDAETASATFLIDSSKIKDIIGKSPIVNTKSFMYVIIKAENEDLQEVKMALESYGSEYEKVWSTYLPDQYELVKNRKIGIKGNYVYMVISEDSDKIVELIK